MVHLLPWAHFWELPHCTTNMNVKYAHVNEALEGKHIGKDITFVLMHMTVLQLYIKLCNMALLAVHGVILYGSEIFCHNSYSIKKSCAMFHWMPLERLHFHDVVLYRGTHHMTIYVVP